MAHIRKKRRAAGNESDDGNTFKGIEKVNKGNMSQFYQGDIQLDPELEEYVRTGGNSRNAIREKKRVWSSRIIPYRIPSWMSHISSNVRKAIQELHRKTCLRFVNYNSAYHRNYIEFGNSNGCSSRVGKRYAEPGRQTISIGDGCNHAGTILHELMHAIGNVVPSVRGRRYTREGKGGYYSTLSSRALHAPNILHSSLLSSTCHADNINILCDWLRRFAPFT